MDTPGFALAPVAKTPLLARMLRALLKRSVRGSSRLTFALARRVVSLQHVPVAVGTTVIHVDLRDDRGHVLLQRSPWPEPPFEPDEQAIMSQVVRPGDVVFDIGGHVGVHTAHLSQLVRPDGIVHVFEPNPRLHDILAHTAALCGNVTLHRFGLSDHEGRVPLFVPAGDESTASLRDWTQGRLGAVERTGCEVRRLDSLIADGAVEPPTFIKCDVEGAERLVFEGARSTLERRDAPLLMYEADARSARAFGHSMSSATEWLAVLKDAAYEFFHVQPRGTLVPIAPTLTAEHEHFNLLAVPAARAPRVVDYLASHSRNPSG